MTCCGSTVPERAIIWRCVQNVDAPMPMTMMNATMRTVVMFAPSSLMSDAGLLKAALMGAPKTCAAAPSRSCCSVSPNAADASVLKFRMTVNSAKNTGSCSSSGRHPEIGLALFSL